MQQYAFLGHGNYMGSHRRSSMRTTAIHQICHGPVYTRKATKDELQRLDELLGPVKPPSAIMLAEKIFHKQHQPI